MNVLVGPDSETIAAWGNDGRVRFHVIATNERTAAFSAGAGQTNFATYVPDGKRFVTCGTDGFVRVWQTPRGFALSEWRHPGVVQVAGVNANGSKLATHDHNGILRIWNLEAVPGTRTLRGNGTQVLSIVFDADDRLISCTDMRCVNYWDTSTAKKTRQFGGEENSSCAVYSARSGWLASSGGPDILVSRPALDPKAEPRVLKGDAILNALGFDFKGACLAALDNDGRLILRDLATDAEILKGNLGCPGRCLAVSGDDQILAAGGDDGKIHLWEIKTGTLLRTLEGPRFPLTRLAFHPEQPLLVSSNDLGFPKAGDLRLWNWKTGEVVHQLQGHGAVVTAMTFTRDGRRLATAAANIVKPGEVKIWDIEYGVPILHLRFPETAAFDMAFSNDDKLLAVACIDHVRIWEALPWQTAPR